MQGPPVGTSYEIQMLSYFLLYRLALVEFG